jgi:hypothetical protein
MPSRDPAIRLIGPEPSKYDVCCERVETVRVEIDFVRNQTKAAQQSRTKEGKKAARRLAVALARVERILKQKDIGMEFKLFFPTAEITRWRKRCVDVATTPSGKLKRVEAVARWKAAQEAVFLIKTYAKKPKKCQQIGGQSLRQTTSGAGRTM